MYKDAERNFDHAVLEADHGPGSALKYAKNKQATRATRLLHRYCNRRGGAWDRPKKKVEEQPTGDGFTWA